jgi:hypothetical protein
MDRAETEDPNPIYYKYVSFKDMIHFLHFHPNIVKLCIQLRQVLTSDTLVIYNIVLYVHPCTVPYITLLF